METDKIEYLEKELKKLERIAFDYSILAEVSRVMNTVMFVDELLEFSLEVFAECTGYARGLILLYNREEKELKTGLYRFYDQIDKLRLKKLVDDKVDFLKFQLNPDALQTLAEQPQRIFLLSDDLPKAFIEACPELIETLSLYNLELVILLFHRGFFQGMIALGEKMESSSFDLSNNTLILSLADLTATCIESVFRRELALIDDHTQVYTFRFFMENLEEKIELSKSRPQDLSLLILDIDRFKNINDNFGHIEGDKVLQKVAEILRYSIRERIDIVSRYGGDEFLILLFNVDLGMAISVAERIREEISRSSFGKSGRISISIGISCYPAFADNAKTLLDQADKALYESKRKGGNTISTVGDVYPLGLDPNKDTAAYRHFIKDKLTQFYVGPYFLERVEDEIKRSKRYQHSLSLIALKIDKYELYLSSLGRRRVDEIIRELSTYISRHIRKGIDLPTRYAGDTLIILLPETNEAGAIKFAIKLKKILQASRLDQQMITFNVGLTSFPVSGDVAFVLLDKVIQALGKAEEQGGGKIGFYKEKNIELIDL